MRKVLEALQAWRRGHGGAYPDILNDLVVAGLLPEGGQFCPSERLELSRADSRNAEQASVGAGLDPEGAYTYELTRDVKKSGMGDDYYPEGFECTWFDLKAELLRRPFGEQVPLLRCTSHRSEAREPDVTELVGNPDDARRNLGYLGNVYWSGTYWEERWLEEVPVLAREVNVLLGLEGPPFHSGKAVQLADAVDFKRWSNAFGDHPWWWIWPNFGAVPPQPAATLAEFFRAEHGRAVEVSGGSYWIDGLVQLQGKIRSDFDGDYYRFAYGRSFPWERRDLPVGRKCRAVSWLQGHVWQAEAGEVAGTVEFVYVDGEVEAVSIVVGETVGRFWAAAGRGRREAEWMVEPVWRHVEEGIINGEDRELRLFEQRWENPRPGVEISSVNFISNRESTAAPFLVAMTLEP